MEIKAEAILKDAEQLLKNEKVEFTTNAILGSNPTRAMRIIAKQANFDLIVMDCRGLRGAASLLRGSVSRQVVAKSECNVLVVKK